MNIFNKKLSSSLGQRGEKAAVNYLKRMGYSILDVNFYNKNGRRIGEIDIIAQKNKEIIFIEVKTRNGTGHENLLPEENITTRKLYKLNKIANFYINKNNLFDHPYRFDAITIIANPNKNSASLKHIKNIFI